MPYANEHAARIHDPKGYDRFTRKSLGDGLSAILGWKGDKSEIQAYRFNKEKYTDESARKWLREHDVSAMVFEPADDNGETDYCTDPIDGKREYMQETFATRKDIFSVGKWNGDIYTASDIDNIVKNFETLKAENRRVPLKVNIFKREAVNDGKYHGGMPAVGWVDKLERVGEKLYATIVDIPRVVKDLIEKKAYRQVSAELVWNMKHNGEKLSRVLIGIGLLGVEMPGVGNLDEFAKMYTDDNSEDVKIHTYEETQQEDAMELKELQDKLTQAEKDVATAKEYAAKIEGEKQVLADKITADEARAKELADGQRREQVKLFVEKMGSEGHILPKHSDIVAAVFDAIDEAKVMNFTADGKEESKSVRSMFESMIGEMRAVDFTEKSQQGKDSEDELLKDFVASTDENAGTLESQQIAHRAKTYALKNNVDYKAALIAVTSEVK